MSSHPTPFRMVLAAAPRQSEPHPPVRQFRLEGATQGDPTAVCPLCGCVTCENASSWAGLCRSPSPPPPTTPHLQRVASTPHLNGHASQPCFHALLFTVCLHCQVPCLAASPTGGAPEAARGPSDCCLYGVLLPSCLQLAACQVCTMRHVPVPVPVPVPTQPHATVGDAKTV